jgi:hypothetical protein
VFSPAPKLERRDSDISVGQAISESRVRQDDYNIVLLIEGTWRPVRKSVTAAVGIFSPVLSVRRLRMCSRRYHQWRANRH